MTDEEIDALPEGREMDTAIAKSVFNKIYLIPEQLPWYSTHIAEAWKLVEMFKMTITPKTDPTRRSQWLADVRLCSSGDLWLAYGVTAPMAICRAALKAVARETANGVWTLPPDIGNALRKKFDR